MSYTQLTKEFILKCKHEGLYQHQIAKKIGCDRSVIRRRANLYGIKFPHSKIKYPVNEEYFNIWSHDMSYILGFIMADGCIRKKRANSGYELKIEVSMKDIEILEYIASKISPTRPIRKNSIHKNKTGGISRSCVLCITLTNLMYTRLGYLGIIPKKSGFELMPKDMPKKFVWSFIRGLFDGDGCIHKRKHGGFDWQICSSSYALIKQLHAIIPYAKIKLVDVKGRKKIWIIDVRDKANIKKLRKYLYKNSYFYLQRKHELMFQI